MIFIFLYFFISFCISQELIDAISWGTVRPTNISNFGFWLRHNFEIVTNQQFTAVLEYDFNNLESNLKCEVFEDNGECDHSTRQKCNCRANRFENNFVDMTIDCQKKEYAANCSTFLSGIFINVGQLDGIIGEKSNSNKRGRFYLVDVQHNKTQMQSFCGTGQGFTGWCGKDEPKPDISSINTPTLTIQAQGASANYVNNNTNVQTESQQSNCADICIYMLIFAVLAFCVLLLIKRKKTHKKLYLTIDSICQICFIKNINILYECGHSICSVCHKKLNKRECPICRQPIIQEHLFYLN